MLVVDGWVAESCWLSQDTPGARRGLCFVGRLGVNCGKPFGSFMEIKLYRGLRGCL